MSKFLRFLFFAVLSLLTVLAGFYFWASSPNFSDEDHAKTFTNNFPLKVNDDSILSIVTYNIGYLSGMTNNLAIDKPKSLFDNNLQIVLDKFKNINADILAFQEIDFASKRSYDVNQQDKIADLGYNYVGQTVNWDKKYLPYPEFPVSMHFGRILSGQSVISKYEITDQERIELERNKTNPFYYDAFYIDRLAQIVKIKILKETLIIINVHLEAFHQPTRIKQTKKIIELYEKYSSEFPTVLLGDFNSDIRYENASINLLLKLPKTGNAVFNKNAIQNTFNSEDPTERLDYIFYNTEFIKYMDGRVLTEFGQASDHLPVIMNFKLK